MRMSNHLKQTVYAVKHQQGKVNYIYLPCMHSETKNRMFLATSFLVNVFRGAELL